MNSIDAINSTTFFITSNIRTLGNEHNNVMYSRVLWFRSGYKR